MWASEITSVIRKPYGRRRLRYTILKSPRLDLRQMAFRSRQPRFSQLLPRRQSKMSLMQDTISPLYPVLEKMNSSGYGNEMLVSACRRKMSDRSCKSNTCCCNATHFGQNYDTKPEKTTRSTKEKTKKRETSENVKCET